MSRFSVDTDALKNAAGQCRYISESIGDLAGRIDRVRYDIDDNMGRYAGVINALGTCIASTYRCSSKVYYYGTTGDSIARRYVRADLEILTHHSRGEAPDWIGLGLNVLSSFGPVGALIGGIGKAVKAGDTLTAWGKAGQGGIKLADGIRTAIKEAAKAAKKGNEWTRADWAKELFGLNKNKTLVDVFENQQLAGLDAAKAAGAGAFKKAICSPVAWFTTAIDKAIGNYNEYKQGGITVERAIGEFGVETAFTVLEGAAVAAGVTALAAAAGIAAPAVVVGAAAAGVVWGIDCISKSLTGKDLAENVSDLIFDTGEKIANAVGDAKKVVSETVDNVKKGVSAAWNGICKAFSFA